MSTYESPISPEEYEKSVERQNAGDNLLAWIHAPTRLSLICKSEGLPPIMWWGMLAIFGAALSFIHPYVMYAVAVFLVWEFIFAVIPGHIGMFFLSRYIITEQGYRLRGDAPKMLPRALANLPVHPSRK